jgi:hypothetical protein
VTKKPEPLPDFNRDEVAFNVEAVRAYLFTSAMHIFEGMSQQEVAHTPVAVMTGAVEFAAQLWMWTAMKQGVPVWKARKIARKEFNTYLERHTKTKPEAGEPQEMAS